VSWWLDGVPPPEAGAPAAARSAGRSNGGASLASEVRSVQRADHPGQAVQVMEQGGPPPAVRSAAGPSGEPTAPRSLVIGCGALARELAAVTSILPNVDVTCLRPDLHNRPEKIAPAVREAIASARPTYGERIFVAYADCGTGGLLDALIAEQGIERLPGAHCYEVYAGAAAFAALSDEEVGTFYLTDFLARNFDRLVWRGLGLDRHPELLPLYFAHYRRIVYLSQVDDEAVTALARAAADRLGLAFEHRHVGLGDLAPSIVTFSRGAA
jgi:hypothetical protein